MNTLDTKYKNSETKLFQLQLSLEILSIQKTYYTLLVFAELHRYLDKQVAKI